MFRKIITVPFIFVFLCWTLINVTGEIDWLAPCPSEIYCQGELLHTVQMSRIFNDSKTFVDMKMRYPPNETLARFNSWMAKYATTPGYMDTERWVNETFEPAGSEFESWLPADWVERPRYLDSVRDPDFRRWGRSLNALWKLLGRKMRDDVRINQDLYSIIWVPHPAIVPGGRFREFYYWDSYWIIKGLLLSEMRDTARGMLDNFLFIVKRYGFVPNGGRIYYSKRSQPPLLIPSVKLYYEHTEDLEYVRDNLATLELEFSFWINNHTVQVLGRDGQNHTLAVYGDLSRGPRPESYYEDVHSAGVFSSPERKEHHYSELKAAAESGWDFSSRWFISAGGTNEGNLTDLNTRSIIPVDLNSFMYENAVFLAEFHELVGGEGSAERAAHYRDLAARWRRAVTQVLWHDDVGSWLDYDILNSRRRDYFYPSNVAPLYNGCYDPERRDIIVRKVRKYLQKNKIMDFKGGIPTSFEQTGEQWDYPNAWPPAQHMVIVGLDRTGEEYAQKIAYDLATTWVRSNYLAFNETGHMYEKYNAEAPGGGGGGEYEIQLGFGWSNGVIMDLLHKYGDRLTRVDPSPVDESLNRPLSPTSPPVSTAAADETLQASHAASSFGQALAGLLVLLVSIAVGFVG